jgi:hypothetical protein
VIRDYGLRATGVLCSCLVLEVRGTPGASKDLNCAMRRARCCAITYPIGICINGSSTEPNGVGVSELGLVPHASGPGACWDSALPLTVRLLLLAVAVYLVRRVFAGSHRVPLA